MEFVISGMEIGGLEGTYLIRHIVFMDEMRYIVYVYYFLFLMPIMGRMAAIKSGESYERRSHM